MCNDGKGGLWFLERLQQKEKREKKTRKQNKHKDKMNRFDYNTSILKSLK